MSRQIAPMNDHHALSAADQVPTSVFSTKDWTTLATMLVNQDVVVLPQTEQGVTSDESETNYRKASGLALAQHWESMGFALGKDDLLRLCAADALQHAWLHKHITPALKKRLGGHVRMKPMYPNFPKDVMEMDEAELLFNALAHYEGHAIGLRVLPYYDEQARKPLIKNEGQVRVLRLADSSQVRDVLGEVVRMNTVWTPTQAELMRHAMPLLLAWNLFGTTTMLPQRENQAALAGVWLMNMGSNQGRKRLQAANPGGLAWPADRVSTTDLLRAAVAYSGGDPSLASTSEKVRFAKMTRGQRRVIMQALEQAVAQTGNPVGDLHGHRQSWLRLAERLHAGEWKNMPGAQAAIDALRNRPAPISWRGELDAVLAQPATSARQVAKATTLFTSNPGFAARALGRVLRWAEGREANVIHAFSKVADRVDTPVLLALQASLKADAELGARERVMLPKGSVARRYRVEASDKPLDADTCRQAHDVCEQALLTRFSELPALGKVFVEDGLDEIIVPKGLRSASDSVGAVTRGSRLPVDASARIVRLFLWWKDTEDDMVDVDLSAVGLNKRFEHTETCNYHGLRGSGLTHSGDLRSAPRGAAEFIDVNMTKIDPETRYVVLAANVFSGPNFNELPECFVGWQERKGSDPQRGKIMELKTVVNKFQVTAPTRGFLAAAFDIKERRLVWLDLPMRTQVEHSIYGSHDNIRAAVEDFGLYAAGQPRIGTLVDLHIRARGGEIVDKASQADTVFSVNAIKAKEGQVVIAATQPQMVASTLMVGANDVARQAEAQATIEAQENPLNELNKPKTAKARVPGR